MASDPKLLVAVHLLETAQRSLSGAQPTDPHAAASHARTAIEVLRRADPVPPVLMAGAWRILALALSSREREHPLGEVVEAFDRALEWWQHPAVPRDHDGTEAGANLWMRRGLALLASGDGSRLSEALLSFEEAMALRATPSEASPTWSWYAWLAGWMNRADALARRRFPGDLEAAVEAHRTVVGHLDRLSLEGPVEFRERHVVAWTQFASTLRARGRESDVDEARSAFRRAEALLDSVDARRDPRWAGLRVSLRLNHAALRLETDPGSAGELLEQAVALRNGFGESAPDTVPAWEVRLTAVVLECRAAAYRRWRRRDGPGDEAEVETCRTALGAAVVTLRALATSGAWPAAGLDFRAAELVRSAARLAWDEDVAWLRRLICEGLEDHRLIREAPLRAAVVEVWRERLARVQQDCFPALNTPRREAMMATLAVLEEIGEWLRRQPGGIAHAPLVAEPHPGTAQANNR